MAEKEGYTKKLDQYIFYHGFLPREDLLYILKRQGDYIVRTTDRPTATGRQRDLILSIAWPEGTGPLTINDIRNIIIKRTTKGMYFIDKIEKFETLDDLIEFYQNSPIKLKKELKIQLLRAVPLAHWEYRHINIILSKKVGQGAYGEVYMGKVRRSKNGKISEAVIKTMKSDFEANDEKMKEVMGEARLMRSLNHPNIVRMRGIAVMEQPYYIIIDFIHGGGLDSYLRKNQTKITIDERNKMAMSAAWGIEFIHSQNIIHRDIAARNCLFDKVHYVKLSDFGLSRKGNEYKMKTARRMPTKWLAPESLRTFTFYPASDVFTYGILLYEIYTIKEPYEDISSAEAKKRTLNGEYPNFEKESPFEIYSIVSRMIYVDDHEKRAPMSRIVKALEEWLKLDLVIDKKEDVANLLNDEDNQIIAETPIQSVEDALLPLMNAEKLMKKSMTVLPVKPSQQKVLDPSPMILISPPISQPLKPAQIPVVRLPRTISLVSAPQKPIQKKASTPSEKRSDMGLEKTQPDNSIREDEPKASTKPQKVDLAIRGEIPKTKKGSDDDTTRSLGSKTSSDSRSQLEIVKLKPKEKEREMIGPTLKYENRKDENFENNDSTYH